MKLDFAFLAESASLTDDGRFAVVGGGFDVISATSFPAVKAAMALVGRVVFCPSEFGKTYNLHGEIVGPSGTKLTPDMWLALKPFARATDRETEPQRENWMTFCLNYEGVSFPKPGGYAIQLSIDDQVLGAVQVDAVPLGGQKK
jgi:hypothetical protein